LGTLMMSKTMQYMRKIKLKTVHPRKGKTKKGRERKSHFRSKKKCVYIGMFANSVSICLSRNVLLSP